MLSKNLRKIIEKTYEMDPKTTKTYEDAFSHFGFKCPMDLKELGKEYGGGFFEVAPSVSWHLYSPQNIILSEKHVPFNIKKEKMVPIIDCNENLFICYDAINAIYVFYAPLDNDKAMENQSLEKMLEEFLRKDS